MNSNVSVISLKCGEPNVYVGVSECTIHFTDGSFIVCKPQETENYLVINTLSSDNEKAIFRKLILKHYTNCRSVRELAHRCGYTQLRTFTRHFKKYMGERQSPYQWMLSQKESDLLTCLTQTEMDMDDIMRQFHFRSYSNFCSFCKTRFGLSPYELRNNSQG